MMRHALDVGLDQLAMQEQSSQCLHLLDIDFHINIRCWQVSPLKGNNQGYYRVITLWGEILSATDKWQKLGRNSFTSFIALQSLFILPCA